MSDTYAVNKSLAVLVQSLRNKGKLDSHESKRKVFTVSKILNLRLKILGAELKNHWALVRAWCHLDEMSSWSSALI